MFNWLAPLSQVLAQQSVPFSSSGSSLMPHSFTATSVSSKSSQLSGGPFLSHPVLRALLSAPPPVLLELVNGLSDDIYSLSRLGLIGSKLGERAARFADWCWLFTTLVGLVGNAIELGVIEGLQREGETIKILLPLQVWLLIFSSSIKGIQRVAVRGYFQVTAKSVKN